VIVRVIVVVTGAAAVAYWNVSMAQDARGSALQLHHR
jgi:hypothetical protein